MMVMAVAVALAAAAGCRQGGNIGVALMAPVAATYPAANPPWPTATPTSTFGRGLAPARAVPAAVSARLPLPPVRVAKVWAVPDDDQARAVVSGTIGDRLAVEVIAVDDGELRWRDLTRCQADVVHVTADTIVCGDARGMVGLDVTTGAEKWRAARTFGGAAGELVIAHPLAGATEVGQVAVLAAASGTVVAEGAPPGGLQVADVRRACAIDGGVELWSWSAAGVLARFTIAGGGAVGPASMLQLEAVPSRVEPCLEPVLVELPIAGSVERLLLAVAREPLAVVGGPVHERGFWRGQDGRVMLATGSGIVAHDHTLVAGERVSDAQVGRELASRGRRRLVRGAGGVPVLLEDERPIAYLSAPAHVEGAVLGDRYLLGGGWQAPARSFADHVQRFLLPEAVAGAEMPHIAPPDPATAPFTTLDLPPEAPPGAAPIDLPAAGAHHVGIAFLDPADPAVLYAAPLEARPDVDRGAGLAAFDLRTRQWRWHTADGCGPGTPVAVAVARDVIACGSRGSAPGRGAVRAIGRVEGEVRWTWTGETVDAVAAAGGLVVVTVGRRALVLDAADGTVLTEVAADDGFTPRLVPTTLRGTDLVIGVEGGAVVARLPRARMLPLWAASVRGLVVAVATAGDRITVELTGGELYFLDPETGAARAAGGWSRRWRPVSGGDLTLAEPLVPAGDEWRLSGYGNDGAPRFAIGLTVEPPWLVGVRGVDPAAPLVLAYGPAARFAAVVDPHSGVVRFRPQLPERAVPGLVFGTVVDGTPIAGAVLSQPLGVVLF